MLTLVCSRQDDRHTVTSFPHVFHGRPVMGGMGLCCWSRHLRYSAYLSGGIATPSLHALRPDLATFVCIVVFTRRFKAAVGQERTLSHLVKTLIQDSTIYFFIMMTFNVAMLVYAVMARATLKNLPLM